MSATDAVDWQFAVVDDEGQLENWCDDAMKTKRCGELCVRTVIQHCVFQFRDVYILPGVRDACKMVRMLPIHKETEEKIEERERMTCHSKWCCVLHEFTRLSPVVGCDDFQIHATVFWFGVVVFSSFYFLHSNLFVEASASVLFILYITMTLYNLHHYHRHHCIRSSVVVCSFLVEPAESWRR